MNDQSTKSSPNPARRRLLELMSDSNYESRGS